MPRITESAQPPLRRVASIRLTRSSVVSRTEARLATLARGIRPIILNSRRCSVVKGCRGAIGACPSCSVHIYFPTAVPADYPVQDKAGPDDFQGSHGLGLLHGRSR